MRKGGVLLGLLLFSGMVVAAQRPDEGIAKVRAMWVDDFKARDAEKIASLYADDATLVAASGERVVGRERIRDYFKQMFGSISSADVTVDSKGTDVLGDLGYDSGLYDEVIVRPGVVLGGGVTISGGAQIGGGGSRVASHGSYLVVLRRRAGVWLIVQQASVETAANAAR
jgi:uncharacterized protein (TIGR02246 family)